MKKYSIIALAATLGTLLIAVIAILLHYEVIEFSLGVSSMMVAFRLMQPFTVKIYLPAVCALLLSMTLTGKIKLWQCGLFTIINITICGVGIVPEWNIFAWLVNLQMTIVSISAVWFAAIGVYGIIKKKPLIWGVCGFQLILVAFLMFIPVTPLAPTLFSEYSMYGTCILALVFMAALSGFDFLMEKKQMADSQGTELQEDSAPKQRKYAILAIALAAAAVAGSLLILLISFTKMDALLFTGQKVHVHLRIYLLHKIIVPAVCTALAGLCITKKITVRWGVLLLLISMGAAILLNVATRMTGISEIYKPAYWSVNATEAGPLACTVLVVFFAVFGSVEKEPLLVLIGITMPLLQLICSLMVQLELKSVSFRWTFSNVMNLIPLLLLAIIGFYDLWISRKEAGKGVSV